MSVLGGPTGGQQSAGRLPQRPLSRLTAPPVGSPNTPEWLCPTCALTLDEPWCWCCSRNLSAKERTR